MGLGKLFFFFFTFLIQIVTIMRKMNLNFDFPNKREFTMSLNYKTLDKNDFKYREDQDCIFMGAQDKILIWDYPNMNFLL